MNASCWKSKADPLRDAAGSARLYECMGCGERKPQDKFPDDPAVPGLCAACDLLVRSDDEPLEAVHREETPNDKLTDGGKKTLWCVRSRDGWCVLRDQRKTVYRDSVETKCGYVVTLPWGIEQREPDCIECRKTHNDRTELSARVTPTAHNNPEP